MKSSQVPFLPLGIGAVFVSAITFSLYGQFLQGDQTRRERFRVRGATNFEGPAGSFERSGRKVPPAWKSPKRRPVSTTSPTASTSRVHRSSRSMRIVKG